ncbi:hypothetical protein [Deinococcus cellulosilyticus]|uniref:Uncharacterized protein n=1 Tax=Deinococcus cellulosilyticus (strain DSM 18568 / NBRC 106333 / KACC 11606 / 5516J-15) TaxID=1223518 RepID=A0A511N419_DEIC1|nr:hypothetical protein [Deinococcus cellulosilyticus]GEM47208.1 hypothetical protein DC3_28430 [Deinococcus cellulosilyticus NBRC 106333 = KACC 11606]
MFFRRIHNRTQVNTDRHTIQLEIRSVRDGVVVCRGSNDTVRDSFGTVITVESLIGDWLPGFRQHNTVSLQHNIPVLRGIKGSPQIGVALRVDFNPQLEVTIKVTDPETLRLLEAGKIGGASLEFLPLPEGTRTRVAADGSSEEVYYRLSSDPEFCGISLVDLPSVPRADLLAFRADLPNWAFAVIDPRVLNGEITDPEMMNRLRWFPHHDIRAPTRDVDMRAVAETLRVLNQPDSIQIPPEASLTREQIISQAAAHLSRHTQHGIGTRTQEEVMDYKKWIKYRVQQLVLEGMSAADALKKAQGEYVTQRPQQRAEVEALTVDGLELEAAQPQTVVEVRTTQPVAPAQPAEQPAAPAQPAAAATPVVHTPQVVAPNIDVRAQVTDEQLTRALSALAAQPENPMAAIAAGFHARARQNDLTPEQILHEAIAATVLPGLQQRERDAQAVQRVYNIMQQHGIQQRALTLEANGAVMYEDMARQFIIRPENDIYARNWFGTLPMGGVVTREFPRMDRGGMAFTWGRNTNTTAIADAGNPNNDTFSITVQNLDGYVNIDDSFALFNAQGTSYVSSNLLPAMRGTAQEQEDAAFFMSTGIAPYPTAFTGLHQVAGATTVTPSTNGDAFTLDVLDSIVTAMPTRFRKNPSRLKILLPVELADDFAKLVRNRATGAGDAYLGATPAGQATVPVGPTPIGYYRQIPVYAVYHLTMGETQGTAVGICGTIMCIHQDIPMIGDAVQLRMEVVRERGFKSILQLQEYVGLGYQFPSAIVRRRGVKRAA